MRERIVVGARGSGLDSRSVRLEPDVLRRGFLRHFVQQCSKLRLILRVRGFPAATDGFKRQAHVLGELLQKRICPRQVMRNAALILGGLLLAARLAAAQNEEGSRPIEVLVGFDGVTSWQGDGHDVRLAIAVPRGERLSFEFFGGAYHGRGASLDPSAIYGFQVRRQILRGRRPGTEPFFTYGAMGVVARSLCGTGPCSISEQSKILPPALGLFGVGVQHIVASHLAVRVEAQGGFFFVIPVGLRVAAAVAVPLGRFKPWVER